MARHDAKQSTASNAPKRATRTNKQLQVILLTTTHPLTQQPLLNSPASRKQKIHPLTLNTHPTTSLLTLRYNYSTRITLPTSWQHRRRSTLRRYQANG